MEVKYKDTFYEVRMNDGELEIDDLPEEMEEEIYEHFAKHYSEIRAEYLMGYAEYLMEKK